MRSKPSGMTWVRQHYRRVKGKGWTTTKKKVKVDDQEITADMKAEQLKMVLRDKMVDMGVDRDRILAKEEPLMWLEFKEIGDEKMAIHVNFWDDELDHIAGRRLNWYDSEQVAEHFEKDILKVFPTAREWEDLKLDDDELRRNGISIYGSYRETESYWDEWKKYSEPIGSRIVVLVRNPNSDNKAAAKGYMDELTHWHEEEFGKNSDEALEHRKWRAAVQKKWRKRK
jgi:hypothetical protein